MKTFQSIEESVWYELKEVELTQAQEELLMSTDEADLEAQTELIAWINAEKEGEVDAAKLAELNAFYATVKPELKAEDIYKLIEIDLTEEAVSKFRGILNCRVNDEHEQIRF